MALRDSQIRAKYARLVKEWKKRLGLGDWKLHVSFLEGSGDMWADCHAHSDILEAEIRFYLRPARSDPAGIEGTVVHELLHVALAAVMDAFDRGLTKADANALEEPAVVRIERALVALRTEGEAAKRRARRVRAQRGAKKAGA